MTSIVKTGLDNYAKYRIPTGGFLICVLENDLMRAVMKADDTNINHLRSICQYIQDTLPLESYGNAQKVKAWMAGRHLV